MESGYKVYMKLRIRNVSKEDFMEYKCLAKNSLGGSDGSITLYGLDLRNNFDFEWISGITGELCDYRDPTTYDVTHDNNSIDEHVDANGVEKHNCDDAEAEPYQEQEKRYEVKSKWIRILWRIFFLLTLRSEASEEPA